MLFPHQLIHADDPPRAMLEVAVPDTGEFGEHTGKMTMALMYARL
jgi:hypothetical protein